MYMHASVCVCVCVCECVTVCDCVVYDSVWCVYDIVCVYVYLVPFPCSVVWLPILMYCDRKFGCTGKSH